MPEAPPLRIGEYLCCFCGEHIERHLPDPCSIKLETAVKGAWQAWFCHAECFRDRLAKVPGMEPVNF